MRRTRRPAATARRPALPAAFAATTLLLLGAAAALSAPAAANPLRATGPDPGEQCRAAIRAAERQHNLPPQLLHAIARVESGRRDPATGAATPWPWTVNAEGQGRFFPSKEEAVAHVRQLQARGVRVIDVGCMQVNLHHHPQAFASLEDAFDPRTNAAYAGRFLRDLQATRQDWTRAAANYHSNTPELAEAYRAKVLAAWPEEQRRPYTIRDAMADAWAQTRPAAGAGGQAARGATGMATAAAGAGGPLLQARAVPGGGGPGRAPATGGLAGAAANGFAALSLSNRADRAQILPLTSAAARGGSGGGATGRGLEAYRSAPISVAGRPVHVLQLAEAPGNRR